MLALASALVALPSAAGSAQVEAAAGAAATMHRAGNEAMPSARARAAAYRKELDALGTEKAVSEDRQRTLRLEIARLESDQSTIQAALVRAADQVRALNAAIDAGVARLQDLLQTETRLRGDLSHSRAKLAKVLATLQRIGRHPPPAMAARPSDALAAIRSAI